MGLRSISIARIDVTELTVKVYHFIDMCTRLARDVGALRPLMLFDLVMLVVAAIAAGIPTNATLAHVPPHHWSLSA